MALEAVVFSQDHPPLTNYTSCRDQFTFHIFNGVGLIGGSSYLGHDLLPNYSHHFDNHIHNESINDHLWDDNHNGHHHSSSPDQECTVEQYLPIEQEAPPLQPPPAAGGDGGCGGGGRRKRRRRSSKNEEEVEQQRMTHIAVERNRRKQMNEYLAVIRAMMPPSYVQRGDQASIVGGAINYVKELEQLLHSLEANNKTNHHHHHHREPPRKQPTPPSEPSPEGGSGGGGGDRNISINDFTGGLSGFPDNNPAHSNGGGCNSVSSTAVNSAAGGGGCEVHVTMVESHANVKILAKKQPKQLLRLVAGFQGLSLSVLHLNVTSIDCSFLLYSFSLKVEEGCQLNSVDDITGAASHILAQIEEESLVLL